MAGGWGPASRRTAPTNPYSPAFYNQIRPGVLSSAAVLVPIVIGHIRPKTVVDVGCGEGWWAQSFADRGCEVIGVDGEHVAGSPLGDRFLPHDLRQPLPAHLAGRFDLAVCLEVAEHLPASRAESLVDDLCGLAPVVLFSAAIPGQGGVGHVHERWPGYWVEQFSRHTWRVSGALRWQLWDSPSVEAWYAQNTLIAAAPAAAANLPALFASPLSPPWPVVHPTIYEWRRR